MEGWAGEVLPPLLEGSEENLDAVYACVRRIVEALGKAGLLRVCVPGAYGGDRDNLDVRSLCLAREIMGRASGLADFALAMQGLGSAPITLYGREDQKRSTLLRVAAGTAIAAFALSEPDAGSDVSAISTTAARAYELQRQIWNDRVDAVMTAFFIVVVVIGIADSARVWTDRIFGSPEGAHARREAA